MKSIAVMQPYFFPYLGYFQLIQATDKFIFYNDVQFIKRGWIHRNRILINNKSKYLTIPCKKASQNKLISEIEHALDKKTKRKLRAQVEFAYKKAPFFENVFPIIEDVMNYETKYISELGIYSILKVCSYLDLKINYHVSGGRYQNEHLEKALRLIDITKKEKADVYVNSIGGKELYTKANFAKEDIQLDFLNPQKVEYEQFKSDFIPWLSIIDVLMFNSVSETRKLLTKYVLE